MYFQQHLSFFCGRCYNIDRYYTGAITAVLAEDTIALAEALPAAAWNDLPVWNGVTLPNLPEGTTADDCRSPDIVFNKDGSVSDDGALRSV